MSRHRLRILVIIVVVVVKNQKKKKKKKKNVENIFDELNVCIYKLYIER